MNTIDKNNPGAIPLTTAELVEQGTASPLLWRPKYLAQSSWLEHIPFAFWLMATLKPKVVVELGSYYGASYFAFCQAVERLSLDTQCFAVDTWKGDEHAGFYEEQVYTKVKQYNDTQYSGFSRLVRTTFDDALEHFRDGSIDLLHIDGFHTYEEVRHDFENWLPKLSERAVVIMHDSNVRERDFGVYRLFEQLQKTYPTFEFLHGHGLGIVGVGSRQCDRLARLYRANDDAADKPEIQELFSRMGRACADAFTAVDQLERADKFFAEVKKLRERTEELKGLLEKNKGDLQSRSKALAQAETGLSEASERHTAERGQLRERASLFQSLYNEQKEDLGRLQAAMRDLAAERDRSATEAVRLVELNQASQQQVQTFAQLVKERDARIQELKQQNAQIAVLRQREVQLRDQLTSAEADVAQHKQQLDTAQARQRALAKQVETLQADLRERDAKLGEMAHMLDERRRQESVLAEQRDALQADLRDRDAKLGDMERMLDERRRQETVLAEQRDALQADLRDRDAKLGDMERMLDERRRQETVLEEQRDAFQADLRDRDAKLGDMERMLDERRRQETVLEEQRDALQAGLRERDAKLGEMERMLDERRRQETVLEEQRDAVQADLRDRDAKLGEMERMLDERRRQETVLADQRDALQAALRDRDSQLTGLDTALGEKAEQLGMLERHRSELEGTVASLGDTVSARDKQLAELAQTLDERQETADRQVALLNKKLATADEELRTLRRVAAGDKERRATIALQEGEIKKLGGEKRELQDEIERSKRAIDERFFELAELTRMLESATTAMDSREQEIEGLKRQLIETEQESQRKGEAVRRELEQRIAAERSRNEAQVATLDASYASLARREAALQHVVRHTMQAQVQEAQRDEDKPFRIAAFLPLNPKAKTAMKAERKLSRLTGLVRCSGLFDPDWYLDRYPDVRDSKFDPLVHYLKFGSAEGRDPGPLFDARAYLSEYPDVSESKMNPLLHYLKHGCKEGRNIRCVDD